LLDRVIAAPLVVGAIGGHGAKGLVLQLLQQIREHLCVGDLEHRHLGRHYIMGGGVDGQVQLAPRPALTHAVLACLPFAFAKHLDARGGRCCTKGLS
jgi:hypothetical protein